MGGGIRYGKPGVADFLGRLILLKGFLKDQQPAHELTTQDGVFGVGLLQRHSLVFNIGTKKVRGQLKLQFLDPVLVRFTKEKPDHPIAQDAVNKCVYDYSQLGLPTPFFIKRWGPMYLL